MNPETIGIIGVAVMLLLMFCGMWIGLAMATVGFLGYIVLGGLNGAFATVASLPYSSVATYNVTAVPLFVFMGNLVSTTGVSSDLYNTAYKWLGQMRGGLAIATCAACAGFAAICGSSVASAVTMGKVCLPEMKKLNYDDSLATGVVASGGTLGILIPPSLGFIMYGIITENSVGHLFMAGILPGVLLTVLFMVVVVIWSIKNPKAGPAGPKTTFSEKIKSLKSTWMTIVLFIIVLGGLYMGVFTPTESGAIGTLGAVIITTATRRLTRKHILNAILDTGMTTAMVMFIMIGAFIFMRFVAISRLPAVMAEFVNALTLSKYVILLVIILLYVILGMFLEIFSAILFTVPIIYPLIVNMGFDPIWFGVVMVVVMEMGLVTPPVGLNVFALGSVTSVPMGKIFKGVWPFVGAMVVTIILMTIWPEIALFIPHNMIK